MSKNVTCVLHSSFEGDFVICNGTTYEHSETLTPDDKLFWIYLGIYVALVLCAGMMSGLTMGLLSLDTMSLTVLSQGGKPHEQKYAKRILPLLKRHHLLLVTLLLANAAAVESMPLFLDKISNPIIAIIVSVTAVLLFGEVVPQAICTRYGLAIGANVSPLVWFLIAITFPISWPIAKLLDCLLGSEHGTFFRRSELGVLVDMHHKTEHEENEDPLTADEAMIIQGALSFRDKDVSQVSTKLSNVYSLDINSAIDTETMQMLITKGYSRVPVYEGRKDCLKGLILVKNLIMFDPKEKIRLKDVFLEHRQSLFKVCETTGLYECLNLFQLQKKHMFAVIKKSNFPKNQTGLLTDFDDVVGVITLEDLIEELIQEEIVDETDVFIDVNKKIKVAKARAARNSMSVSRMHSIQEIPVRSFHGNDDEEPLLSQ